MDLPNLFNAIDPAKLAKLRDKEYRDEYMASYVRSGIAYQIRALREQFGMSQAEFATKIGKPQSVVSRLENTEYGKVSVQTLLDIACRLDIALLVRFVSYPGFLDRGTKVTRDALRVEPFTSTKWCTSLNTAAPVSVTSAKIVRLPIKGTTRWNPTLSRLSQSSRTSLVANQNTIGTFTPIHAMSGSARTIL